MKIRWSLFSKEAILFISAFAAGLFIAYRQNLQPVALVQPLVFDWQTLAAMVIFFFIFSFVLTRFRVVARIVFRVFLLLVVFTGGQLFFSTFVPGPFDTIAALLLIAGMLTIRNVLMHNIGVLLGIAGISALLGLSITPSVGVVILALLSVYDIIAVYKTRHMVALAQGMMESGAIFGLIVPTSWGLFFHSHRNIEPGEQFMILGSGDVGLPIMFAASLVSISLANAFVVGSAAVIGLFVTHLLFVNQRQRQAMAALPPIATASILGYALSLLIFK